ncbi:MAG: hypothetical protein P8X39_08170 [Desulfofustis sp.]
MVSIFGSGELSLRPNGIRTDHEYEADHNKEIEEASAATLRNVYTTGVNTASKAAEQVHRPVPFVLV